MSGDRAACTEAIDEMNYGKRKPDNPRLWWLGGVTLRDLFAAADMIARPFLEAEDHCKKADAMLEARAGEVQGE